MRAVIIQPLTGMRVVGEIVEWTGHAEAVVKRNDGNRYRGTLKETYLRQQERKAHLYHGKHIKSTS